MYISIQRICQPKYAILILKILRHLMDSFFTCKSFLTLQYTVTLHNS